MGWRGDDNRERDNERDRKRHPVQLALFVSAVVLFYAVWVAASFR